MKNTKENRTVKVSIDNICQYAGFLPSTSDMEQWIRLCREPNEPLILHVRLVDQDESQSLNATFRKKDKPTNILSFIEASIPGSPADQLGTLVICPEIIEYEYNHADKNAQDHWAHIIIHGTLHLLGYDHENDHDAEIMEAKEIEILKTLGIHNPYQTNG